MEKIVMKEKFKIPAIPPTTSKTVRFPNDIIAQVEEAIKGKDCTFSAFVVEATRWALKDLKENPWSYHQSEKISRYKMQQNWSNPAPAQNLHHEFPWKTSEAFLASRVRPFFALSNPAWSFAWISSELMISALTDAGAFGSVTENGIPPTSMIWLRNISIAVDIGIPNWRKISSACSLSVGLTRKFKVAVFSVACHPFLFYCNANVVTM